MKKTLIALATAAALTVGFSATNANAGGLYVGFGGFGGPAIGVGFGGGYGWHHHPHFGYGGYYNAGYGCTTMVKKWVWNPWAHHMVPVWKKVWVC